MSGSIQRGAFLAICSLGVVCGCDAAEKEREGNTCPDSGHVSNEDASAESPPNDVPMIPIGLDAYRQWERLPYLKIGARAYMRSTYDRSGGNEAADASHFLRQEASDFNVTLDVEGPGVLSFVRTNRWHGSPWHYVVDATDHIVAESSTASPTTPVMGSVFIPEEPFPNPLTWTWSTTQGADLNWVPMPFEQSLTLAYGRTFYGTGYYIYHRYPEGASHLSQPIESWQPEPPTEDVLSLLTRAGEDIAPTGQGVTAASGVVDVPSRSSVEVTSLTGGPAMIRALSLRIARSDAAAAARARLRITWDGGEAPSVDAPLPLFFGAGTLYNRNDAEYLVRALLFSVRFSAADIELSTYFPMPYFELARIELTGGDTPLTGVRWSVRTVPYSDPPNWVGYFHATYRDHGVPELGKDLVVLDTTAVEGGGDFCGTFAGMSWIFSETATLSTLEGDPRFFFDDSQSPQAYGTGTEEWGGGGDYWGGRTMTLPLAGHPTGAPSAAEAHNADDLVQSAYRLLVADSMPFGKNARIQLEHGGINESLEHYHTVAYWYGRRGACLTLSDSLHVSDPADEQRHDYVSPDASDVQTLSSRYEWGVDRFGATELFPETTDTGRFTRTTSEFTLQLRPDNVGVLLRRKLDYALADQRAEVWVADDEPCAPFRRAGIWYLAGSNTSLFSFPPGELDPPALVVQTSNRRWREDEFLVPRALTEGRSSVRIRIVHAPTSRPLHPGAAAPEPAWSEYRYWAYSWVLPSAE